MSEKICEFFSILFIKVCFFPNVHAVDNSVYGWNEEGNAFFNQGKYLEALDAYNKAFSINLNFPFAQSNKEKLLSKNDTITKSIPTVPVYVILKQLR